MRIKSQSVTFVSHWEKSSFSMLVKKDMCISNKQYPGASQQNIVNPSLGDLLSARKTVSIYHKLCFNVRIDGGQSVVF
jgi:hypothetical protein